MPKFKYFIFIALLLFPGLVGASTLSLSPAEGAYGPGDSFALDVLVDDISECVNTFSVELDFPKDYLQVVDFLDGESLINLWLEKPDEDALRQANAIGKLEFSGGIPGGYCGRIPGDPGQSNLLVRIIFSIPGMIISDEEKDYLEINFSKQSTVLLNDGLGTADQLLLKGAIFELLNSGSQRDGAWKNQIRDDKIQPEPFIIELRRDPDIFNGQYYIIFNTNDKQSGIDRYEVLEIKTGEKVGVARELTWQEKLFKKEVTAPNWKIAEMPYVLEDQSLSSTIKVRAIDKAGNERYVEYVPPEELRAVPEKNNNVFYLLLAFGFVLVLVILLIIIIIRKSHAKKNKTALPEN